ncbi:MAG TPA: hypothetical protein PLM07_20975 [Candidatus Rifleibacterium sp.]|nr:hypothetical protein [Candidatus Rifleibacterium sp.]
MKIIPDAMRRPAEIERDELRRRLQALEEREAACCPEDVPFDEYIKALESKFEQMRDALKAADDLIDEYAADYEHRDNVDEIREEIKAALAAERGE